MSDFLIFHILLIYLLKMALFKGLSEMLDKAEGQIIFLPPKILNK